MKRLRQFFAGMLFGQSQVRRESPQLKCTTFQLGMAPTEGLLSLFARTDIANEDDCTFAGGSKDMIQADFDRKRGTVFPSSCQV